MGFFSSIVNNLSDHKVGWKVGIGCGLSALAVVESFIAAPKAIDVLMDIKEDHKDDDDRKEYAKDVIKNVTPIVALPIITEVVALAFIISGTKDGLNANAALAAAYSLSEKAYDEYRLKTREIVGERKQLEIEEGIARDKAKPNKSNVSTMIDMGGDSIMYESLSGKFIKSTVNKIDKAAIETNKRLYVGMENYITVSEWLYEIGIDIDDIPDKKELIGDYCFTQDKEIDPTYTADILEDGRPYIIISYNCKPTIKPNYNGLKY